QSLSSTRTTVLRRSSACERRLNHSLSKAFRPTFLSPALSPPPQISSAIASIRDGSRVCFCPNTVSQRTRDMAHIEFLDETMRDGQQSLGGMGMQAGVG